MDQWHEIIRAYDNLEDSAFSKSEKYVYSQPYAIIILMYLALGKDYPYHIAQVFKESTIPSKIRRGSTLKNSNKIGELLNKMREDGLLTLSEDRDGSRRVHKNYKINPEIIRSPARGAPYIKADGNVFEIPLELLESFFTWLEETYNEEDRKAPFIKALETVRQFDYITFLMFLKDRAVEWEEDPKIALELATDPKLSQLIEEYINELEKRSDIDPRPFKKLLNFYETLNKNINISKDQNILKDPRSMAIGSEEAELSTRR
jgi:hypothetical protein